MRKSLQIFISSAIVLLSQYSSAMVHVYNASPSYISQGQYYLLDLDNSGSIDYIINVDVSAYGPVTISCLNGNKVETNGSYKAIGLNMNAPVGTNTWQDSAILYDYQSGGPYFFQINAVRYLGLQLNNTNTYYGYFALTISGSGSLQAVYLTNYGWEDIPGLTILAGSTTSVGIHECNLLPPISISILDDFIVFNMNNFEIETVQLLDLTGKINLQSSVSMGTCYIPRRNIYPGIYFLTSRNRNQSVEVRKIFIN